MTTSALKKRRKGTYHAEYDQGRYAMRRNWENHPVFSDTPFTDREVWGWLIAQAAYAPRVVDIDDRPFQLNRGELTNSLRFMGEQWGWDKGRVTRILKKFQKWGMIEIKSNTPQIHICICNYNTYQFSPKNNETDSDTGTRRAKDNDETKKNKDKKDKKDKNLIDPVKPSRKAVSPIGSIDERWKDLLKSELPNPHFKIWISPLSTDGEGYLVANNNATKNRCQTDYALIIEKAFTATGIEYKGFR